MFCLEFNLLSDILFYKKSIKVFVLKWFKLHSRSDLLMGSSVLILR